mgnify:CR=1 FL=1
MLRFISTCNCTIFHKPISIHLMLRFIIWITKSFINTKIFQYISCYGLSITFSLDYKIIKLFQYISCYGLSPTETEKDSEKGTFQYISCYGLSCQQSGSNPYDTNFNTSHVTVYRNSPQFASKPCRISIHLMLRFINFTIIIPIYFFIISIHLMLRFIQLEQSQRHLLQIISIHLMLRFIIAQM